MRQTQNHGDSIDLEAFIIIVIHIIYHQPHYI
jgi:hypothetical protein